MNRTLPLLMSAALFGCALNGAVLAQGSPQTVAPAKIDPQSLATGWRASKIIGSSVTDGANNTIGTVDDLIVTSDEKVPVAVLSVGGFLGVGSKLVLVPYSQLKIVDKKLTLPGATKDSLKSLPSYTYSNT